MKKLLNHKRFFILLLGALGMVAFLLRIYQISQLDLWRDEAFTTILSQKNIPDLIKITVDDANAPVLQLILHFWMIIFGTSELSVRFPSLIFSLATLPYLYLLSKRMFSKFGAFLLCSLYAYNITSIYFAREARAYAILAFFTLASFYHLIRIVEKFSWKHAILFIIYTTLAFYSHNLAIFFIATEGLYILYSLGKTLREKRAKQKVDAKNLFIQNKKFISQWIVALTFLFILCLPWLIAFYNQAQRVQEGFWLTFDPVNSVTETLTGLATGIRLFTGVSFDPFDALLNWGTIFLLLMGTSYELLNLKKQKIVISYFFWLPMIIMYFYSFSRPLLYMRYVSFLIPFMLILVYKGISALFSSRTQQIIVTLVIIILNCKVYFFYYLPKTDAKAHYQELVEYIANNAYPKDSTVHIGSLSFFPYEHYYQEDKRFDPETWVPKSTIYDPNDETPFYVGKAMMFEQDFSRNLDDLDQYERLWVVILGWEEDRKDIPKAFTRVDTQIFEGSLQLELWEKK